MPHNYRQARPLRPPNPSQNGLSPSTCPYRLVCLSPSSKAISRYDIRTKRHRIFWSALTPSLGKGLGGPARHMDGCPKPMDRGPHHGPAKGLPCCAGPRTTLLILGIQLTPSGTSAALRLATVKRHADLQTMTKPCVMTHGMGLAMLTYDGNVQVCTP